MFLPDLYRIRGMCLFGLYVPYWVTDILRSSQSLLVPLPPDFPPFLERINKLLAPSFRVLGIVRDSIKSGEQSQFAQRVWDKAWTDEPFLLASKTFTGAYERWKEKDETADEEDDKKNSP